MDLILFILSGYLKIGFLNKNDFDIFYLENNCELLVEVKVPIFMGYLN